MIFVVLGNHDQEFTRLIRRIDEISSEIKERIIIQRGFTKYKPKNCESFKFAPNLESYFKKARLIVAHAGIGTSIDVMRTYKKPLIMVPRKHQFNEHVNDHQIDSAKHFEKKWGVKIIYNINNLTPKLLKNYKKIIKMHTKDLEKLRVFIGEIIKETENE